MLQKLQFSENLPLDLEENLKRSNNIVHQFIYSNKARRPLSVSCLTTRSTPFSSSSKMSLLKLQFKTLKLLDIASINSKLGILKIFDIHMQQIRFMQFYQLKTWKRMMRLCERRSLSCGPLSQRRCSTFWFLQMKVSCPFTFIDVLNLYSTDCLN